MSKIFLILIVIVFIIFGFVLFFNNKKHDNIIEVEKVDSFINEFDNYKCPNGYCKG